jgi:hypothetical protein
MPPFARPHALPVPLNRVVPTPAIMLAVTFVSAVLSVAETADLLVLVPAQPRRQPAVFNPHPRTVIVSGPVIIAIVVKVIIIPDIDDIVGNPDRNIEP